MVLSPCDIYRAIAAAPHPCKTPIGPALRQHIEFLVGTLHQRLSNRRRTAGIAIDLERRTEIRTYSAECSL